MDSLPGSTGEILVLTGSQRALALVAGTFAGDHIIQTRWRTSLRGQSCAMAFGFDVLASERSLAATTLAVQM